MTLPIALTSLISMAIEEGVRFAMFLIENGREMPEYEAKAWIAKEREKYKLRLPKYNPETGKYE